MKPCDVQPLPPQGLKWESFIDLLGKAHATIARFSLLTKKADSLLRKREVYSQFHKEPINDQQLLAFRSKKIIDCKLSSKLLCAMHYILKKDHNGQFRKIQNWIGAKNCAKKDAHFLPPPPEMVREAMRKLNAYGNKKEKDPLVQLAIYFAQLLIIHPFMDGNGRLARSLVPIFLYKKGLISTPRFYLSAYFKRHRLEYFKRLYMISKKKDWEGWIRFFLQGIIEEGELMIRQSLKKKSTE